jgi:hypothetical protein
MAKTISQLTDATTVNAADELIIQQGGITKRATGAELAKGLNTINGTVNVKDFGAAGDGVADDTAAIQAALTAIAAAGGGSLVLPRGTYRVTQTINITAGNIHIEGYGATIDATGLAYVAGTRASGCVFKFTGGSLSSTTLASTASAGATQLSVTSATGIQAGQLIRCISNQVQYTNSTVDAHFHDQNIVESVAGTTITLQSSVIYPLTVSPHVVTVWFATPIRNISVKGLKFLGGGVTENLANGNGRVGVWGERVENLEVTDCQFDGFQGIAVGADYYHDVRVDGCYFVGIGNSVSIVEGQNSGFYGAYVFRGRRALMTRCTGVRVRHLYDATESIHVTQSLSMATKTHRAAFGSHEEVYGLTVVDNIAQDCVNGIVCRAFTSSIVSNHFDNCSGPAVTTATMTSSDNSGVLIATGNKLNSVATTNGTVQISGNYSPLVLNANFIENAGVPATGPAIRFNTQKIVNAVVKGNTINAGVGVDVLPPSSVMPTCVGLDISGNTVVSYTGNMVSLRGSTVASTPADNIRIAENFGVPTLESSGNGIIVRDEGFYGENVVIRENSQFGDSSTVVNIAASGWRMRAHPIVEHNDETNKGLMGNRSIAYGTAGTVASNVTVNRGGIIERTNPTTGAPSFWVVTTQGTEGTITGVTGDIASGSTVLTLTGNDQTKVYLGSYITIAGAGAAAAPLTRVRVVSISDDFVTATVSTAASTTVTGAAISRANPTITASGNLA